jgi:hypothetical protein
MTLQIFRQFCQIKKVVFLISELNIFLNKSIEKKLKINLRWWYDNATTEEHDIYAVMAESIVDKAS